MSSALTGVVISMVGCLLAIFLFFVFVFIYECIIEDSIEKERAEFHRDNWL